MTDRLKGVVVTFDKDIREDDAEAIINAIYMIRNVASVNPLVTNYEDRMARERARQELANEIYEVLKPRWMKDD